MSGADRGLVLTLVGGAPPSWLRSSIPPFEGDRRISVYISETNHNHSQHRGVGGRTDVNGLVSTIRPASTSTHDTFYNHQTSENLLQQLSTRLFSSPDTRSDSRVPSPANTSAPRPPWASSQSQLGVVTAGTPPITAQRGIQAGTYLEKGHVRGLWQQQFVYETQSP